MAELTASDVETGAQQEPRSPSAVAEAGGEQGGSYAGNSFKELSQRLHRRRRSSGSHHRKPKSNPKGWHRGKHRAEDLEARPNRIVNINAEQDFEFCTNFVKTSKYEPYSFLPLFLWEEFNPRTKIANVYFLFIAVLQVIPSITNTFGIPTMLLPLVFVVAVDAVFMVIEDVERHRADRRANSSPTAVWDAAAGKFRAVSWSEVHVGDILKIRNREAIPADVLLLSVAEPDPAAAAGICYVETKSLDGETNLKIRQVPKGLVGAVRRSAEAGALRGRVVMEHPNRLINNFAGTLVMAAGRGGAVAAAAPIDAEALLLRGCTLRNTRHALGLVLNTGMDTKIMMSMTAAPTKASRLSARVNREIKRMAVVMLAFCALGAALSTAWLARDSRDAWYLKGGADRYVEGQGDAAGELVGQYVIAFFYYMLLLNSFIPISLYVSMNFVRFFQAWFMNQDLEMYHEETDTPARVRTMNLNEDLGQVSHVFSDKTGTLTCNVMDFRKCSVGGKVYGRGITEIGRAALEIAGKEVPKEVLEAETLSRRVAAPHVNFYDPAIFADMHPQHGDGDGDNESAAAAEAQAQRLAAFFTALALCHTVIPEKLQDGEVVLSASSPDDEALVLGAKYFGFEFLDRADTTALIRRTVVHAPVIANDSGKTPPNGTPARTPPRSSNGASALSPSGGGSSAPLLDLRKGAAAAGNGGSSGGDEEEGDIERYEVLHVLPFNSDRKRMSVIVRCPDGAIRLFCKGADTVMLPRLRGGAHVVAALDGIDAIAAPPAAAALASPLGQATFWASPESRRGTTSTTLNAASSLDGHTAALVDMAHATVAHMDAFAAEGLRTLVVASAVVPNDKFAAWAEQFDDASGDLDEINKRNAGEPNRIEDLMDVIEMGLELLGSTAIEDKLQEGVPGAIASIMAAGIKVWVLTGDKEETAINIGVACQLIWSEERMDRLVINLKGDLRTTQDIADALESRLAEAAAALDAHEADPAAAPPPRPLCLVIDGPALLELLRDQGGQRALLRFAQSCHSVVACRVTPDQKRAMVALVRRNVSGSRTLAIGDGANDVPMIQGAHIGVGISGQEGMQAVNASDYAIAQFRFLRRLMLVHGRWNYRRSSRVVCYLFYKSVLNAVPLFYYAFYNGFSGTLFYDFITTNLYAVVFTALPVLLYGIYDRDVSAAACLRYPELYVEGIADAWMSPRVFWSWMFQALAEGVWVTIVPLYLFSSGDNTQGMGPSLLEYGSVTFCLVVLVATLKMVWVQGRWAPFSVFILFLSAASWFLCTWVASVMLLLNWDFYGVFAKLMGNPSFWLAVAWCFAGVAMRDAAWKFHHRWWSPMLHHVVREYEALRRTPPDLEFHRRWWSPMLHHVVREYEALRRTPPDLEELLAARGARPGADKAQVKPTDELDLDRNNLTTSDSSPGPPSTASSAVPPPQPLRIAVEGAAAAAAAAAAAPQPLHGTPQTRGGGGGSRPPSAMATPRLLPEPAAAGSAPRRSSRLSSLTSDPRRTSSLLDATPLAFIPGPWSGDAADAPGLLYGADAFDPDLGGSIVTPRSSAGAAAAAAAAAAAGNVPGSRPLSGTFSLAGLRAPSAPALGGGGGVHDAGGFAYSADPAAQQAEISMILGRAQGPFPSRTGLPHQGQHHPRRHSELQPPSHTTAAALAFASPPSAHRAATAGAAAYRPSRLTGIREAPSGDGGGSSGGGAAASSHAEAPPPSVAHLLFAPAQEAAAATPSPPADIRAALLPPGAQQQRSTRSNSEPSAAWAAVTSGAAAAADAAAHRDRDKGTL